jgi:hypothetical protein
MKKKFTHIVLFLTPIILPLLAFAETPPNSINIGLTNPIKADSVSEVMLKFFQILIELGAVVVTLAIIYAGFLFVMAKGNPEELNKAKSTLFWTIIGSLVLLGAQVIADIIEKTIKQL